MKTDMLLDLVLRMAAHARSSWALRNKKTNALIGEASSCCELYDKVVEEFLRVVDAPVTGLPFRARWQANEYKECLTRVYFALVSDDSIIPVETKFSVCSSIAGIPNDKCWIEFCRLAITELRNKKHSDRYSDLLTKVLHEEVIPSYRVYRFNEFMRCCKKGAPCMSTAYFNFDKSLPDSDAHALIVKEMINRFPVNPFTFVHECRKENEEKEDR